MNIKANELRKTEPKALGKYVQLAYGSQYISCTYDGCTVLPTADRLMLLIHFPQTLHPGKLDHVSESQEFLPHSKHTAY